MGAATAERLGSTPFWCTPKLLSFRSFALLLRSIKPDRENATNVHDDVQSIFKLPSSYTALPRSHSHAVRTFSLARSLSDYPVFRLSVTVLLARAPYRDSRQQLTTIRPSSAILVAFRLCRWCNVVAAWCRECQLKFLLDFQRDLQLSSSRMILEYRNRSTRIKGEKQATEVSDSRV